MATLNSREFIVAGGFSSVTKDFVDTVNIFNTNEEAWIAKPWMKLRNGPRMDASCTAITWRMERTIVISGGYNNSALDITEMLDTETERWMTVEANQTDEVYTPALSVSLKTSVMSELSGSPVLVGGVQCTGYTCP